MRRVAIFSVVALAAIGIAFAVLPFTLSNFPPEMWRTANADHCSAPVVSAFRTPHDDGWFGYAPLTSTPISIDTQLPTCRAQGQRRLQYAGMFILAALVIAVAIRRAGNDEGDSPPNLAVP